MLLFSIGGFGLLTLFTLAAWVLTNIGGAILLTLMGEQEIHAMPMSDFLSNFVGSPMFYIYLVDISALIVGVIGLVVTKEKKKTDGIAQKEA